MAHHDVADRPAQPPVLLRERLEQALADVQKGKGLAVLCLDLDRFKDVNDTLGHAVGDALLKAVGERLRSCVREADTVARLGGDEFAILQADWRQPIEAATALAQRIIEASRSPSRSTATRSTVGTSIGIAISPGDGTDAATSC